MFGRPFGDVGADFGRSRADGWMQAGEVGSRIAPRGLGVSWEPFCKVGILQISLVRWELLRTISGIPVVAAEFAWVEGV